MVCRKNAEISQNVYFRFKPSCDYVELILDDTKQEKPIKGWIIDPLIKPCRVSSDMVL